jgi:outer membrane protein
MLKVKTLLCSAILLQSCADHKIAFVHSEKVLSGYERVSADLEKFKATVAPWSANVDTLRAELSRASAGYQRERDKLSPAVRSQREVQLTRQQQQLEQYQAVMQQKANTERERLDKEILNEINPFLKDFARQEGYKIIFSSENGSIAYADDALDVTDEVIAGLNKRYRQQRSVSSQGSNSTESSPK